MLMMPPVRSGTVFGGAPRRSCARSCLVKPLLTTGGTPMDVLRPGCEPAPVSARKPSPLDEADGASAAGALLVGDLDGAVDALERVSPRYLVALLWRLGLLMPSVSCRLAWRLARRRLGGTVP